MTNTVKLLPTTSKTWTANDTVPYGCYTDARYMFSKPTVKRNYVRLLYTVLAFNGHGMTPTRKAVAEVLGEPTRPGWGSSKWAALQQAGLLDSARVGRTTVYFMTPRGLDFLKQLDAAPEA